MTPLKLGMVGGGQGAFIGGVHRFAARLDGKWQLVAGALSSDPERAAATSAPAPCPMLRAHAACPGNSRCHGVTCPPAHAPLHGGGGIGCFLGKRLEQVLALVGLCSSNGERGSG